MQQYWVYLMTNRGGTLYVGVTHDLRRRAWEHKNGVFVGFTSKYRVDRLVYFEVYLDSGAAMARERQIKAYRRQKKLALINSVNPRWNDLSA